MRPATVAGSLDEIWQALLEAVYAQSPSLATSFARSKLLNATEEALEIEINGNDFNLKRIQRPENIKVFKRICRTYFGREMTLQFKASPKRPPKGAKKKQQDRQQRQAALSHPLVAEAVDIFDGQVVDVKILKEDEE